MFDFFQKKNYTYLMKRFFGKIKNEHMLIDESEHMHLSKVLRMKVGDEIIVNCNDEFDYYCTIESITKSQTFAKIESKTECPALPKRNIVLFQAIPKKEYFDTIIAKSIELGVSKIQPFTSQFTVVKDVKKDRTLTQIMTACKQCERSKLAELGDVKTFSEMLNSLSNFDVVLFANEDENETSKFSPNFVENKQNIAVIVGAEAGFSPDEREAIKKAGAKSITLGKRILRNDTACVAMLTLAGIFSDN